MTNRPEQFDNLLDAYLDDLLDDEQRQSFEQELQQNAELQIEVQLQREIDDSLARLFTEPRRLDVRINGRVSVRAAIERSAGQGVAALEPRVKEEQPVRSVFSFLSARRWRPLSVAAAILFTIVGSWLSWRALMPGSAGSGGYDGEYRGMLTAYQEEVDAGFKPSWTCKDDREFQDTFADRFQQALLLRDLPDDLQAIGLSYTNTLSPRTLLLLVVARGEPVLVFVDRVERRFDEPIDAASGLNRFDLQLGRLLLYELTPHDEALVLPRFVVPSQTGGAGESQREDEEP